MIDSVAHSQIRFFSVQSWVILSLDEDKWYLTYSKTMEPIPCGKISWEEVTTLTSKFEEYFYTGNKWARPECTKLEANSHSNRWTGSLVSSTNWYYYTIMCVRWATGRVRLFIFIWTPIFEWCVVHWRSKNGTPTRHMLERDWFTCSKFKNHSRLNSQQKLVTTRYAFKESTHTCTIDKHN